MSSGPHASSQRPSSIRWQLVERKQRIEELFEVYQIRICFPSPQVCRVSWEEWSALLHDGLVLDAPRIRALGWKHGVPFLVGLDALGQPEHVDIDIAMPSETAFRTLEDGLIAVLECLKEQNPTPFLALDALDVHVPPTSELPQSAALLERMYADHFIPREKKEPVVDLNRTRGVFLVSVDDDPLVMIDAMSQISTLPAGFTPAPVQAALDEGRFDELMLHPSEHTPAARQATAQYEAELRAQLPAALHHFSHTNSGAEANEKAFALARLFGPGGKRVVAFEGSFHGRTLISLFSTWNPEKRGPYELAGYETLFAPFPDNKVPQHEPETTESWLRLWSSRDRESQLAALQAAEGDELARREIESLLAVHELLRRDDICCVITEPMQSEGGDNYGTGRFFNGLRALTRTYGVPLIFDEVQTGYGLSGPLWWHSRFQLHNADGQADHPDMVTWAKKFQLGGVASVWADPTPTAFHPAAALRGAANAEAIRRGNPEQVQARVRAGLDAMMAALPAGLVTAPRALGYAFALDLPTAAIADKVVAQRFYQGAMVYKAGAHTLRYRLNAAFSDALIEQTLRIIHDSLLAIVEAAGGPGSGGAELWARMDAAKLPAWKGSEEGGRQSSVRQQVLDDLPQRALDDTYAASLVRQIAEHPNEGIEDAVAMVLGELDAASHARACALVGLNPSYEDDRDVAARVLLAWADRAAEFRAETGVSLARFAADYLGVRIRYVEPDDWDDMGARIIELQALCYEPARRDAPALLERAFRERDFVAVVAEKELGGEWVLVGMCIAGPLEDFATVHGPDTDPMRGRQNTLYSVDVTVHPEWRGKGVGLRLKAAQIGAALRARSSEGTPRYSFLSGRNRVGATLEMGGINDRFGAYEVARYEGEYGEADGVARYYRIPLRRSRRAGDAPVDDAARVDVSDGIATPLGTHHPELLWARNHGRFDTAAVTKLTLSNFVTPAFARYVEALREIAPESCRHMYTTSCRGETVDKTIRALKVARPAGDLVISFDGAYFGESTAAARSVSDFTGEPHADRLGWFDWWRAPHPGHAGDNATVGQAELMRAFSSRLDSAKQVATRSAVVEQWLASSGTTGALADAIRAEVASLTAVEQRVLEHGAQRVLAVFAEVTQERTGRAWSPRYWAALGRMCGSYDLPLVVGETASALFRHGGGAFWGVDELPIEPDAVLWYPGGQLGHVFINDRYFLAKPLQLISTWDGDDLSARRVHWTIRTAHREPIVERARDFEHTLRSAVSRSGAQANAELVTAGLFAAMRVGVPAGTPAGAAHAAGLLKALAAQGVHARAGLGGRVVFAPSLVFEGAALARLGAGVEAALVHWTKTGARS